MRTIPPELSNHCILNAIPVKTYLELRKALESWKARSETILDYDAIRSNATAVNTPMEIGGLGNHVAAQEQAGDPLQKNDSWARALKGAATPTTAPPRKAHQWVPQA